MRSAASWVFAVLIVVFLAFVNPIHADTYKILDLSAPLQGDLLGIDAAGNVDIFDGNVCGALSSCYMIYTDGVLASVSETAPAFTFDNGTPCLPLAGAFIGRCNNGHEGSSGFFQISPTQMVAGVFSGTDLMNDRLESVVAATIYVNANGDIAWTDSYNLIFEAIDLSTPKPGTTPEPGTFLLMFTGLVGLAGAVWRKVVSSPAARPN